MKYVLSFSKTVLVATAVGLIGCASVQPLSQVASKARQPRGLRSDIVVDTSSRVVGPLSKLTWAGYTVTLECESNCSVSRDEQARIAAELAEKSFESFDRELRASLASGDGAIDLMKVSQTVAHPGFAQEIRMDSFTSRIGKWFEKLRLNREPPVSVTAAKLKVINPNEIGWSGETSLQKLGQSLGVDAVLVAHTKVTVGKDGDYEIVGPKLWVFSSKRPTGIATARLRQPWRPDGINLGASANRLNLDGIDVVAKAYSERFAHELRIIQ